MKINNASPMKPLGGIPNSETHTRPEKSQPAATAAASGQAAILPLSSRLQELQNMIAAMPAVDTARIAEIKQTISDGRFQINADKVADGLIASAWQMLEAQSCTNGRNELNCD